MHYTPNGRGDVLDIMVHQNVHLSEVIVTDILDVDHLQIMFSICDHVRTREALDPVEKFTDWEQFQSLGSELISPRTQIHTSDKGGKAACDIAASVALACRL
jgi:hypothetical protein